jgi:hypothetical protein
MNHDEWIHVRDNREKLTQQRLVATQLAAIEEEMRKGLNTCHLWDRLTEGAWESLLARKFAFSEAEQPLGGWKVTWW